MSDVELARRKVLEALKNLHTAQREIQKFVVKKSLADMTNAERLKPIKFQDLKKAQDAMSLASKQFRVAMLEFSQALRKNRGR